MGPLNVWSYTVDQRHRFVSVSKQLSFLLRCRLLGRKHTLLPAECQVTKTLKSLKVTLRAFKKAMRMVKSHGIRLCVQAPTADCAAAECITCVVLAWYYNAAQQSTEACPLEPCMHYRMCALQIESARPIIRYILAGAMKKRKRTNSV